MSEFLFVSSSQARCACGRQFPSRCLVWSATNCRSLHSTSSANYLNRYLLENIPQDGDLYSAFSTNCSVVVQTHHGQKEQTVDVHRNFFLGGGRELLTRRLRMVWK